VASSTSLVLFGCVHNAGKSQMAASLMRAKAGNRVRVLSGGTHHGNALNAQAQNRIVRDDIVRRVDELFAEVTT
jgi:protein-tyrosine-phosphatase